MSPGDVVSALVVAVTALLAIVFWALFARWAIREFMRPWGLWRRGRRGRVDPVVVLIWAVALLVVVGLQVDNCRRRAGAQDCPPGTWDPDRILCGDKR